MKSAVKDASVGRFCVGVDFGTTFTSIAFAHSVCPEDVKLVQSWPNGSNGNGSADQVPTELHYTSSSRREHVWGYEIPPSSRNTPEPLKWFKLLLQNERSKRSEELPEYSKKDTALRNISTSFRALMGSCSPAYIAGSTNATPAFKTAVKLKQIGIQPVAVVEDFLRSVRTVAIKSMETTYDQQFVKSSTVQYIITIPAIWNDSAKGMMIKAAAAAGYGVHRVDFHLVSEPEAAAAHTLRVIQPHNIRANDTFIICDAGGGTVDLISYKIRSMAPLIIDEVVSGTGGMCGSVYLDDGFKNYIENKLGEEVVAAMSPRARDAMEKCWQEQVKFKFTTSRKSRKFEVVVPGLADNPAKNIEEGFHTMTRDSVKGIFDPIIARIIKLVREQVNAVEQTDQRVAAILLVGGFGCSPYLFERLQAETFGIAGKAIEVIQPVNARTAIARGALLRGLDGSNVANKRARRFYGVPANTTLASHPKGESRKYWCAVDGEYRVPEYLTWYIKKNALLGDTSAASFPFKRNIPIRNPSFVFTDTVLAYDLNDAPDFKWLPRSDPVYQVCTFTSDLSKLARSGFPIIKGKDGNSYYKVSYSISMSMESDVLKFEMVYDEKSYGEVKTKFE